MVNYVRTVEVVYGDSSGSLGEEDINKGFGGQYVYLKPKYTFSRNDAARGFSFHTTYVEDLCANDLSKGDGKDLYRYIHAHYRPNGDGRPIGQVYLSTIEDGDGHTADLNRDRGGRYLYLCWKYTN
ncbi:hypothetical protein V8B97DRAFT_1918959 [Scleroderma yunnanense]